MERWLRLKLSRKAGKSTGGLPSSSNGLREGNKPRHYADTTHNYGNFFTLGSIPGTKTKNDSVKKLKLK